MNLLRLLWRRMKRVLRRFDDAHRWSTFQRDMLLGRYGMKHVHVDGNLKTIGENVCILSIFSQNDKILQSVLGLIRAIRKEGYGLILVVNGAHAGRDWFQGGIGLRDIVITRPNLGRDFAAYQLATNLLIDNGNSIQRLLYCNDSVFFLDKNDSTAVFRRLISSDEEWIGMTENYEIYHVSSWCFQVGPAVLKSPFFIRFWKTYLPIDHHHHAIRQGEIRLTHTLLEAGFAPRVLFNTQDLLKALLSKLNIENEMQYLHELCTLPLAATSASGAKSILASLFMGEQRNQTTNLVLLLISELAFPFIKKNIAFQCRIPLCLVLLVLERFMSCYGDETAAEIRRRGVGGSFDVLKGQWKNRI